MSTAQQVANSFVTEFFERLAKNPTDLVEMYGHHCALHINDFEMGNTEAYDTEVPQAFQKWAAIVQGSQLCVESVSAAPVHGGVNVFVSASAMGAEQQQYFQMMTSLEAYSGFTVEGFYIRHQTISRIGAMAVMPPTPVPEPAVEVETAPAPSPAPVAGKEKKEKTTPKASALPMDSANVEEKPAPIQESMEEAPKAEEKPASAVEQKEEKPAAPAKPKSWASLASSAAKGPIDQSKPIRVVAHDGAAAAAQRPAAPVEHKEEKAPAKELVKREKKSPELVGDRLMFNVSITVSDEDIKTALGAAAAHLVSLRNNSGRGHVFMDFAEGYNAIDELRAINPTLGPNRTRLCLYRQHSRN